MLRLPKTEVACPRTLAEALELLARDPEAMPIAGGTDLLPNMKHELFEPGTLVSLQGIDELRGIELGADGTLVIGAMTTLAEVAADELVRGRAPALAQAASLVAGPQLRSMGTLGGNVMLDTRCQWYNQTYFWRQALGFCLKKDGELCHVVAKGKRCVAAASNDSVPALMSLGASIVLAGPRGRRELSLDDFWLPDGIQNKKAERDELLVEIRVPAQAAGHRGAYGKLRDRGSIDFPLLGVAVRLDLDDSERVEAVEAVLIALVARPQRVKKLDECLLGVEVGSPEWRAGLEAAGELAHAQCRPMPNIPGDHEYRREMVPVYLKRTLRAAAAGEGPVHHI